jgi:hypothetical protein
MRQEAHNLAVVGQVHEVAWITFSVVRLARALRAVQLAAHQGKLGQHGWVAHERRDLVGQLLDGDAGRPLVTCRAPAPCLLAGPYSRDRQQRHPSSPHPLVLQFGVLAATRQATSTPRPFSCSGVDPAPDRSLVTLEPENRCGG